MTMTSLSPDTRGCRFLYHYLIIIDIVMDPRPTIFIFVFRQRDDALLLVLLTLVHRFPPFIELMHNVIILLGAGTLKRNLTNFQINKTQNMAGNQTGTFDVTGSKTMEKKSKCDSCDKSFDRAFNLRRHKLANHKMARFLCSLCDLSYNRSDSLSSHMQIVHEGRLVKCDQCDHKTTSKAVLKSHLRSMHGFEMLQCDLCDYKSIAQISIRAHKKRVHDGENKYVSPRA